VGAYLVHRYLQSDHARVCCGRQLFLKAWRAYGTRAAYLSKSIGSTGIIADPFHTDLLQAAMGSYTPLSHWVAISPWPPSILGVK